MAKMLLKMALNAFILSLAIAVPSRSVLALKFFPSIPMIYPEGFKTAQVAAREGFIAAKELVIQHSYKIMLGIVTAGFLKKEIDENDGGNLLHWASRRNCLTIAQFLLNQGANIDALNKYRQTPLHLAALTGNLEIIQFLIKQGANINAINNYGRTPLHLAVRNGSLDIARLLVDHKANIDAIEYFRRTSLHLAVEEKHLEITQFLVAQDSNIEATDEMGRTPLHYAVQKKHLEIVKFLLDHKANIDAKDENEITPLHLAVSTRNLEIIQLLVERGARIDARTNNGKTPLHWAIKALCSNSINPTIGENIVSLLLFSGAQQLPDAQGRTPLILAHNIEDEELRTRIQERLKGIRNDIPEKVRTLLIKDYLDSAQAVPKSLGRQNLSNVLIARQLGIIKR